MIHKIRISFSTVKITIVKKIGDRCRIDGAVDPEAGFYILSPYLFF
jgi:hypothetical protein